MPNISPGAARPPPGGLPGRPAGGPPGRPAGRPKTPAAQRRTALLLTSILAVLAAVLLLFFVLRLAESPGAKVNLGDQEFNLGRDTLFAPKVTAHGPLIFAPLRGSITLYVQHLGDAPGKGWLAFGAHDPGQAPTCRVVWRPATHTFVDPCNGAVYPANGVGLDQYPTRVDANGDVIVNLRQAVTPTTVPTSVTSTSVTPTSVTATSVTATSVTATSVTATSDTATSDTATSVTP